MNRLEQEAEQINALGDRYLKNKMYNEAIGYYKRSYDMMIQAGNMSRADNFSKELEKAIAGRAAILNSKGDQAMKNGQYLVAMQTYEEAWSMLRHAGEKLMTKYKDEYLRELNQSKCKYATEVLLRQALTLTSIGKYVDAATQIKKILEFITPQVSQATSNEISKSLLTVYERWADFVNQEGDMLYRNKRFPEAIQKYAFSVQLINQSNNEVKKKDFKKELSSAFHQHAQGINTLGDQLMKEGNYLDAAQLYEQSVTVAQEGGLTKLVEEFTKELTEAYSKFAQQINNKADDLFNKWKYQEATEIYLNSVEIAKVAKNKKLIEDFTHEHDMAVQKWMEKKFSEAIAASMAMDYNLAVVHYQEAHKIIEQTQNSDLKEKFSALTKDQFIKLAEDINKLAHALEKEGNLAKAYEMHNLCVILADLAQNEKKLTAFRNDRDRTMPQ